MANRSTKDTKKWTPRGSLVLAAAASGLGLVAFSSTGLRGEVRIFNPIGAAVVASSARTTSRSQTNISPTTPGLSQPSQTEAPEDKSPARSVRCHRGALHLQINRNKSLLFPYPHFPAATWARTGRHTGAWLPRGSVKLSSADVESREHAEGCGALRGNRRSHPDPAAEALLFLSPKKRGRGGCVWSQTVSDWRYSGL